MRCCLGRCPLFVISCTHLMPRPRAGSDMAELNEDEAAAERTAKRARTQGSEAVFAALQQAEAAAESKGALLVTLGANTVCHPAA